MATAALRAPRDSARSKSRLAAAAGSSDPDVKVIVRELAAVADYIAHIKQEIGALRANELYRDRIPTAHDELGSVVKATASATHSIMKAAEDILEAKETSFASYKAHVDENVLAIFEACSFQDITGQRISKVVEALRHVEKRLSRFASAVNARDSSEAPDPEDALRQARREVMMLNGPAADGAGVKQDDIDKLFA